MSDYQTLLEKFGGSVGIHEMAFGFHQKLLKDQHLRRYFRYLDIDDFIVLQQEFFEVALGKPIKKNTTNFEQVRQGFGIEQKDFPRFAQYIIDTLEQNGLTAKDKAPILSRVTDFAEAITGMSYNTNKPASSSSGKNSSGKNNSGKESQTIFEDKFEDKEVDYENSCI